MTEEEFKKLNPKLKHLEGDELWDAMTLYLEQSKKKSLKKNILRYQLYKRLSNIISNEHPWSYPERCNKCKKGIGSHIMMIGKETYIIYPKCGQKCEKEPNKNITHKIYNVWLICFKLFFKILEKIHLIKKPQFGDYNIFEDKLKYVEPWKLNIKLKKDRN